MLMYLSAAMSYLKKKPSNLVVLNSRKDFFEAQRN